MDECAATKLFVGLAGAFPADLLVGMDNLPRQHSASAHDRVVLGAGNDPSLPHRARAHREKTGKTTLDIAYGITSRTPDQASFEQVLRTNRAHWCIENSCHYTLDWNYDEDRCRIRTAFGPENVSRLRRFAVGLIKSLTHEDVATGMRQLCRSPRLVFDYLRMTANSAPAISR